MQMKVRNDVSTSWVNGGGVDKLKSGQERMRRKRARSTTETIQRRTNWSCMEPAQVVCTSINLPANVLGVKNKQKNLTVGQLLWKPADW